MVADQVGRKTVHVGLSDTPEAQVGPRNTRSSGEMLLDLEQDRVLPEVNEERCSGCGSCKNACPQHAISVEFRDAPAAIFGPLAQSVRPFAQVDTDACASCGLCASTCPSHAMGFQEETTTTPGPDPEFTCDLASQR